MPGVAVVTGANSGIGKATAVRLAQDGYTVFAGARHDEGLEAITAFAEDLGLVGQVLPIRLDVADDESVEAAFAAIAETGPVLVLVNNAGISGSGTVEDTPIADYQAVFDTNVLGVIRCTQQVLPAMREAGYGRIVNISSASAILGPPVMSSYGASKFALEGLSESLQAEVAPFGIRVIVLRPGTIMTPIWGKSDPPPSGTAYDAATTHLMTVLMHNLTKSGVKAAVVGDVIGDAVAADDPSFRYLVGDADVHATMRAEHTDEELLGVYALEGDEFRARYTELSGIDYWAE
jgi:NAD(P)-dependent dehydrogenase (short-subunit alcohol dehydrogenase family)